MTRYLKTLGLALVAAMAMTAVMASAANAQFTADQTPVTLTGNQQTNHEFSTAEGKVTCTTATFHGHQTESPSSSVIISPTYTGCTAFGFVGAKVTGFGHYGEEDKCFYVFNADGTVDLECDGSASVVIDLSGSCDVKIAEQTDLMSVSYKNEGEGSTKEVHVTANVGGIAYENTGHNFSCTLAGVTHYNAITKTGKYTGTSKVTGENPSTGAHIGVSVDPEEHS